MVFEKMFPKALHRNGISLVLIFLLIGCDDGGVGKSPNDVDNDGDGVTVNEGDCNDAGAGIYPGASEICLDGIDQDCNGTNLVCPHVTGQALLGPLTNAAVEVFR